VTDDLARDVSKGHEPTSRESTMREIAGSAPPALSSSASTFDDCQKCRFHVNDPPQHQDRGMQGPPIQEEGTQQGRGQPRR
jgi:hypothetical protein